MCGRLNHKNVLVYFTKNTSDTKCWSYVFIVKFLIIYISKVFFMVMCNKLYVGNII
jgi:hypothetical protein